jgi:maltooligosyltrehalose trehalohydrolase
VSGLVAPWERLGSSGALGARLKADGRCSFRVWAPDARRVQLELEGQRVAVLDRERRGYHATVIEGVAAGARYRFVVEPLLDSPAGGEPMAWPDPASRWQPDGVHEASAVLDPRFEWHDDAWSGVPLSEWILYELHVGTFTDQGTFDAAIGELDRLVNLGVNVVEVMPVAQFPGARNWGYDGVDLFAVQNSYGGPVAFKRFVDACHQRGLAVVLDVVYNHLGPEGNYLDRFGPYFSSAYRTPWGSAINFDGGGSDEVRRFFIDNALMWLADFHVDGLRLDAVHGIIDTSPRPFLAQLAEAVQALEKRSWRRVLIAESDANDPRLVRPPQRGGEGLDGVWADDFHHALHVALTGETKGYYCDYQDLQLLARALERGFAYTGQHSPHRNRSHGAPADDVPPESFVVCVQNHDQVGNRAFGDRLPALVDPSALRLAAGLLLCSPHTPLLFMGEEYGETRPFLYFTSHGDPELVDAVRAGRKREFAKFEWGADPPDPQALETFERSRLDPRVREQPFNAGLEAWYRRLIALRKDTTFSSARNTARCELIDAATVCLTLGDPADIFVVASLSPHRDHVRHDVRVPLPPGSWVAVLDSEDDAFAGQGAILASDETVEGELRVSMPATWLALLRRRAEAR